MGLQRADPCDRGRMAGRHGEPNGFLGGSRAGESQAGSENGGNVGVENNIPEALADPAGGNTSQRSKSGETINYEIGNTRREVIREAGEVRRVSVAVLVNGIYSVDGSDVSYEERAPEEINRLTELVKTAVGFDGNRGDQVSVDSLRFMDYSMDVGDPASLSLSQLMAENFGSILRGLLALAVVGTVLGLGVRPLMAQLRESAVPALAAEGAPAALAPADASEPARLSQAAAPGQITQQPQATRMQDAGAARTGTVMPPMGHPKELVSLASVEGQVQRGWIDTVSTTIDSHPEESLRVVKSWLAEDA